MNMHYVMMVLDIAGILGIILILCGAYCLTFGSNDWRTERAGKILVIIGANLVISFVYGLYYDHNSGSSSSDHTEYYSPETTTERDYYDKNDARNTDRHYDDDEYKEALKKSREAWDAQTK